MEKKNIDGIMIFAMLHMLSLLPILFILTNYGSNTRIFDMFLVSISIIFSSIGVIYRKKIAKNCLLLWDILLFIFISVANIAALPLIIKKYPQYGLPLKGLFILLISFSLMLLSVSSVYYFTRPKVKEQFK